VCKLCIGYSDSTSELAASFKYSDEFIVVKFDFLDIEPAVMLVCCNISCDFAHNNNKRICIAP